MALEFSMYNGFLITDDSETNVKAYRNREYYAGNLTSYEAASPANIGLLIDEVGDHGDFTVEEYNEVMRVLGRPEFDRQMLPETARAVVPAYPSGIMKKVRQSLGLDLMILQETKRLTDLPTIQYSATAYSGKE